MSAKPWEEEWALMQSTVWVKGTNTAAFRHADRLVLATAAPDMARALLAMLRHGTRPGSSADEMHTLACWDGIHAYLKKSGHGHVDCERLHAALTKAGVTLR